MRKTIPTEKKYFWDYTVESNNTWLVPSLNVPTTMTWVLTEYGPFIVTVFPTDEPSIPTIPLVPVVLEEPVAAGTVVTDPYTNEFASCPP